MYVSRMITTTKILECISISGYQQLTNNLFVFLLHRAHAMLPSKTPSASCKNCRNPAATWCPPVGNSVTSCCCRCSRLSAEWCKTKLRIRCLAVGVFSQTHTTHSFVTHTFHSIRLGAHGKLACISAHTSVALSLSHISLRQLSEPRWHVPAIRRAARSASSRAVFVDETLRSVRFCRRRRHCRVRVCVFRSKPGFSR